MDPEHLMETDGFMIRGSTAKLQAALAEKEAENARLREALKLAREALCSLIDVEDGELIGIQFRLALREAMVNAKRALEALKDV